MRLKKKKTCLDGCFELEQNGLRDEYLASLGAEVPNLGLKELNLLAGAAAADLQETVDYRVEVDIVVICHGECVCRQELAWWWQREEEGGRAGGGWVALWWDKVLRSQTGGVD